MSENKETFGLTVPQRNSLTVDVQEMKTVHELCQLTGISRKTLYYYDKIGILTPTRRTGKQKSKLYSNAAVQRLETIRNYQESGLLLKEIQAILDDSASEKEILKQAIERMRGEKEKLAEKIEKAELLLNGYQKARERE